MKKMILSLVVLIGALSATEARADDVSCSLTVNGATAAQVQVNQSFTYEINIVFTRTLPSPGPWPPPPQHTITFYGYKNGTPDIPGGEVYPGTFGYGYWVLGGYWNPGGYSGHYQRYAVVSNSNGYAVCVTNLVSVYLN